MTYETLNRVLEGAKPSGAQKKAMLEGLWREQRAERRGRRWPRAALVAALAAAVLTTAAAAANPEGVARLIARLTVGLVSTQEHKGYTVDGDVTLYPLDVFSEDFRAMAMAEGIDLPRRSFDSREETQAFLGQIPLLWPEDWGSGFRVQIFDTELDLPWGVEVYSTDIGGQAGVDMKIYTEYWPRENEHLAGLFGNPEDDFEHLERYPMANGATAEILMQTGPEDHPNCTCTGHFLYGGVLYEVSTYGNRETREDMVARLKVLLDGFRALR